MVYLSHNQMGGIKKSRFYSKKWFKITMVFLILIALIGGTMTWKTGSILNKITKGGLMGSLIHTIPGVADNLKSDNGRTNILLLGMRGDNMPGGGLLADTIMVVSIVPKENKVSMISVPRDLYVTDPGTSSKSKINAVYAYGEENGKKQGLEDMKIIINEVTGLPIHYAISINFAGFKQLVDAVNGVEITLDQPFSEPLQFREPQVCDPNVYTIPTGEYQYKKDEKGRIVKQYPLCHNANEECGGEFNLPAGKQTLDGAKALCFVRSRVTTSDFERAKRQQLVLKLLKDKLLNAGTLTDMGKVNNILNALGDNVRSDLQAWELGKLFDLYKQSQSFQTYQRVLENSDEGLLYNPPGTKETGYILLPIGDNYDKIHDMAQNIFTLPPQSDIKPK